jgi:hypothetical protein
MYSAIIPVGLSCPTHFVYGVKSLLFLEVWLQNYFRVLYISR